jgi:molecular chaperone GrpE
MTERGAVRGSRRTPVPTGMAESDEKGGFQAEIPENAIEAALRSVEKIEHAVDAAEEPEAPAEGEAAGAADGLASEVQSLHAQLELSTAKGRETMDRLREEHERLLRAAADLDNYRKRAAREREEVQRFGVEKLVKDLLPAVDNLDRALAAAAPEDPLATGVRLVRSALEAALAKHGVVGFSALGEKFDPALHEALMQVPAPDQPPGTVVVEHARGFKLNDRLVRPAMVGVAVGPPKPTEG